jgi:structural maintenance of chromosomes protein 6
MCHAYTTVSLGSRINFIVGHNGSGKSAVLTGITVCLGGKAAFTNRASSIKELIKEGESKASVTVRISNRGSDAYRHDTYGDTITVVREFGRETAGSYKIKSSRGKVIAGTREELSNICDHMQIEVDNPMTILTQDTARQFLANSTAQQKYSFFLKGTQLERLKLDYTKLDENREDMSAVSPTNLDSGA